MKVNEHGDLSKHFFRKEFACKDNCGFDVVDAELIKVLEYVRSTFLAPVTIIDGCACERRIKEIGGNKKNLHRQGKAVTFAVEGVELVKIYTYLDSLFPCKYGLGYYSSHIYFDIGERRRWTNEQLDK